MAPNVLIYLDSWRSPYKCLFVRVRQQQIQQSSTPVKTVLLQTQRTMGDHRAPLSASPGTGLKSHNRQLSGSRVTKDPPIQRSSSQQHPFKGSPPTSAAPDGDNMSSPQTTSKRAERIFPISSVVNRRPTPAEQPAEPLRSISTSERWSASTPTPYIEDGNSFSDDGLYVNFNEKLNRQWPEIEREPARFASMHDTYGAQNVGALKHPMTMRFEHKETEEGHCVVTVCFMI